MSEEDIKIQENGEVSSEDDAFDKQAPSPAVPCPYIDFVPLQSDSKSSKDKGVESEDEVVSGAGSGKGKTETVETLPAEDIKEETGTKEAEEEVVKKEEEEEEDKKPSKGNC
jgi:hypothetical protein